MDGTGAECATYQASQLLLTPPWDTMAAWLRATGPAVRFTYLNRVMIIVGSAEMAHAVFASRLSNYRKDQESYKVFGDLLGTGLVTSEDERWRRGRALIAPPFKREMLQTVAALSVAAARRVAGTLRRAMQSDETVDLAEEFRHMTLQVIGEAVLSMTPAECDASLPALYLPIVEEANVRAWYPMRAWLPLPSTFHYNACVRRLNNFVVDLIKRRIASKHVDASGRPRVADLPNGASARRAHARMRARTRMFVIACAESRSRHSRSHCARCRRCWRRRDSRRADSAASV